MYTTCAITACGRPVADAHVRTGGPSMTDLPAYISRTTLCDALRMLGIDPAEVRELHLEPQRLTVTQYQFNEHGEPCFAGDQELATVTTVVPISD